MRHEQYRSVKISPSGEYLAATAVVTGQVVLELVDTADRRPRALRPREGDDIADCRWVAPDRVMYTEGVHVGGIDRPILTGELFSFKADGTGGTRWVIERGIADPTRICVYDGSYGGYAAMEGAVKEPDLHKCAIDDAGIFRT